MRIARAAHRDHRFATVFQVFGGPGLGDAGAGFWASGRRRAELGAVRKAMGVEKVRVTLENEFGLVRSLSGFSGWRLGDDLGAALRA